MTNVSVCRECGKVFAYFDNRSKPKTCPTCADKIQHRPSIVLERECIAEFSRVRVDTLPDEWEEYQATPSDEACFKIDFAGRKFGKSWSGRIVIYAPDEILPGDVVTLKHMRVVHQVRAVYETRTSFRGTMEAIRAGGSETVTYTVRTVLPVWSDEGELEEETREYITLTPVHRKARPTHRLVWATARTKTTLKGLGAQYWQSIDASGAEWTMTVEGGVRSGRDRTIGVLAVLPIGSHLIVSSDGYSGSGDTEPYTWRKEI